MQTIKHQFDLHTTLFNNVLSEITNENADKRLNTQVNHLKWLAGHVTNVRLGLLKMVGLPEDNSLEEFFAHGSKINDSINYPSLETIVAKWNEVTSKIENALSSVPEAILASDSPVNVPFGDKTTKGFLAFLMHHEAYHIGQMGILRKYLGNEAMKYD